MNFSTKSALLFVALLSLGPLALGQEARVPPPIIKKTTPPASSKGTSRDQADLYKRWSDNEDGTAEKQKIAYDAGKEYVKKYSAKTPQWMAIDDWLSSYERTMARKDLYGKFISNANGDAQKRKLAHDFGKEYVKRFGNDGGNGAKLWTLQFVEYLNQIKRWMTEYEATLDINGSKALLDRFFPLFRGTPDQKKLAYDLGKEFVSKYNHTEDLQGIVNYIEGWLRYYENPSSKFDDLWKRPE